MAEFNVISDFGAVGAGQTDDAPAISAALTAAEAAGFASVYLPAGQYLCASPIARAPTKRCNVVLRGADQSATQLLFTSPGNGLSFDFTASPIPWLSTYALADFSILAASNSPSGMGLSVTYGLAGSGGQANPGSSARRVWIGPQMQTLYGSQPPGAGWANCATFTTCNSLVLDDLFLVGTSMASGVGLNLASCINATVRSPKGFNLGQAITLTNANPATAGDSTKPGWLPDCQSLTIANPDFVGVAELLHAYGTAAMVPNGCCNLRVHDWLCDASFDAPNSPYRGAIILENVSDSALTDGWAQFASCTANPIRLVGCQKIKLDRLKLFIGGASDTQANVLVTGGSQDVLAHGLDMASGIGIQVDAGSLRTKIDPSNSYTGCKVQVESNDSSTVFL